MIFDSQPAKPSGRRGIALSMGAHAVAFGIFLQAPALRLPRPSESEYRQKIAGKEDKIVFYKFRRELPNVTPPKAKTAREPLRAEVKAKQTIVSSPKNAPRADRMIWTPAPEIAPAPRELPNVLAVKLPDPPPKPFVAPPPVARPEVAKQEVPDAPDLKPVAQTVAELKTAPLPYKQFVRPASAPKTLTAARLAPDAPDLEARAETAAALPSAKLPPKPFAPPPGAPHPPAAAPGHGRDVGAPPPLDTASNSRDLNIAIVGLNPNDKASVLPAYSSPGQFSAGPVIRPKGADSEGGGNGLSVPDLFVRGEDPRKKPDIVAQAFAAPTSEQNIRAALSRGEPMIARAHIDSPPAPEPHSAATKVSGAPDPRFNGREVFMMAIQMPNITSYSGSWLMWYSDRTAHELGLGPIAAPVAHRKVDPKYIATAVEERIEGRVTLACVIDKLGHVSGVELVRGIDDRLNRSAEEALSKWEFFPATRKGEPVEVDVLVEIPFHLEPKLPK
jgi:TonB family protein